MLLLLYEHETGNSERGGNDAEEEDFCSNATAITSSTSTELSSSIETYRKCQQIQWQKVWVNNDDNNDLQQIFKAFEFKYDLHDTLHNVN